MKIKHLFLSVLAVATVAVACNKNEAPSSDKPSLTLNPTELTFEIIGGTKTIAVEANREWSIVDGDKIDWVKAEKASDTEITVTVEPNTSFNRGPVEFTVRMVGVKKNFKVSQKGSGAQEDAYVYHNNFDKEDAVNNSGWPYLDKSDCWKNEEGSGVATVAYASSGASARQSGKLSDDKDYSDYAGSGKNKIFFGKSANFQIKNITLPSSTDFELTFGGNKYGQNESSNVFSHDEFKVYVSNDGSKYVELAYTFANGDPDGKWSLASSKFTVPSGTSALYIYFQCTKASVYSIDDVTLLTSATAGTAIDFSKGTEIGGGTTPDPTPTPSDAIFSETFSASQGDFTIDNKSMSEKLTYVWSHDASYHYMKASAFVSDNSWASESWLISPDIDLTSEKAAYLSFDHTANKFPSGKTAKDFVSLKISKDGASWDNLTIPTWPAGTDWKFVSSGSIDLKAYLGSKVKIAFVYTSTDGESGSWEIKNVLVKAEGTSTEPTEPSEPDTPSSEYTSNVTWTLGTNSYTEKFKIGTAQYELLRIGKSKDTGDATILIPKGSKKLTFYAYAWKGEQAKLKATIDDKSVFELTPNSNDKFSGQSYSLTTDDIKESDVQSVDLTTFAGGAALSDDVTVKLATERISGNRVVIFAIKAE